MNMRTLKVGEKEYRLKYTTNIMCQLEKMTGCGINKMSDAVGDFSTTRYLLWAGLQKFNHEITVESTGNLIDEYIENGGTTEELSKQMMDALKDGGFIAKDEKKTSDEGNDTGELPGEEKNPEASAST